MDGHAATRAIRAGGFASLPIIALTANAFPEDAKLCREAGMSDFLAKPLRKQTLVDAMLRALGPGPEQANLSVEPAPTLDPAKALIQRSVAAADAVQPGDAQTMSWI